MKRIFALLILLATFAIAQTDSTDILITIREDGDTTAVGRWRAGMPVLIRDSWDGWGSREKLPNKFVIIRSGISKAMIDSFLVAHSDSTSGLRCKYQLSRAAIQFVKNNRDANNVVRVTPAQLRNAFKRANRLRRFGEPQRMSIIPDRLYIRWRNMLIGATPTTATVNTDGGGDYTSLAAAEAGEQKDLETANEQLTISCRGTTADVTAVTFDGWTTDATRNIVIEGDNNTGVWGDSFYTLDYDPEDILTINAGYVVCNKIQFTSNPSTAHRQNIVVNNNASVIVINCIFDLQDTIYNNGVAIAFQSSANCFALNNIIFRVGNDGLSANMQAAGTAFFFNNTVLAGTPGFLDKGIYAFAGNCIAKNNIVQGFLDGYSGTFATGSDYNISDIAADAPGANSLNSTTVIFADAANGDFRLLAGSPGIDQGVDLSADPNYAFNTAIDGTIRLQGSGWDIGAFEYVQPATNNNKKSRYKGFETGFKGGWKK